MSFNIGDKVWLSSKNITTRRPSKKLDHKHLGPFKVIGKSRTAYELDLPTSMGIFNKFHASLLVKDPNDPLVGQEQPEPGPILVDGTDHYEVDEFLAIQRHRRSIKALVKWVGYENDPQWYPLTPDNFGNCLDLLKDYYDSNPNAPKPEWIS